MKGVFLDPPPPVHWLHLFDFLTVYWIKIVFVFICSNLWCSASILELMFGATNQGNCGNLLGVEGARPVTRQPVQTSLYYRTAMPIEQSQTSTLSIHFHK